MGALATYTAVINCPNRSIAEKLIEKFAGRKMSAFETEAFGRFSRDQETTTSFMVFVDYSNVVDIEGDRFPFEEAVDHFASIYEKIMDELEAEMGEDNMSLSGEFQLYPAVYGVAVPKSAREILNLPSASEKLKGTAGSSKISLRPILRDIDGFKKW